MASCLRLSVKALLFLGEVKRVRIRVSIRVSIVGKERVRREDEKALETRGGRV